MSFAWFRKKVTTTRRQRRRATSSSRHYELHKERARELVHARLTHWNQFYGLIYKRVAIRNQRSRWGSCSTKGNLNFNYRLIFLPESLVDYIIVHELCHLRHFNHGTEFWLEIEKTIHDYRERKAELHTVSKNMHLLLENGIASYTSYKSQISVTVGAL